MVKNKVDKLRGKHNEIKVISQDINYDTVDEHIENNVVDLPSMKVFLKKLSKIVLYKEK